MQRGMKLEVPRAAWCGAGVPIGGDAIQLDYVMDGKWSMCVVDSISRVAALRLPASLV